MVGGHDVQIKQKRKRKHGYLPAGVSFGSVLT